MPPSPQRPARALATEFGDEGDGFATPPLSLVHPTTWAAQAARDDGPLERLTVYLEPRAPSSASIALHLFGAALDAPTRDHIARVLREGIEQGLTADAQVTLAPREQSAVRLTTLGGEHVGRRSSYTLRREGVPAEEAAFALDLFIVALEGHTLFASLVAADDDWDDAASAFALVAASLTLS